MEKEKQFHPSLLGSKRNVIGIKGNVSRSSPITRGSNRTVSRSNTIAMRSNRNVIRSNAFVTGSRAVAVPIYWDVSRSNQFVIINNPFAVMADHKN